MKCQHYLDITRFTNSQNAVRAQDFIALESVFSDWASSMANTYKIFLETQRGGIDARKAREKQHPKMGQFDDYVNAFDLIMVYGAGWMAAPGMAFGKNAPFLPKGSIYERIVSQQDVEIRSGARFVCSVQDQMRCGLNRFWTYCRPSTSQQGIVEVSVLLRGDRDAPRRY